MRGIRRETADPYHFSVPSTANHPPRKPRAAKRVGAESRSFRDPIRLRTATQGGTLARSIVVCCGIMFHDRSSEFNGLRSSSGSARSPLPHRPRSPPLTTPRSTTPRFGKFWSGGNASRFGSADVTTSSPTRSPGLCRRSSWPSACGTRPLQRSACPRAASTTSATRSSRWRSRPARIPAGWCKVCGTSEQMLFQHYRRWMPSQRRGDGRRLVEMLDLGPEIGPETRNGPAIINDPGPLEEWAGGIELPP